MDKDQAKKFFKAAVLLYLASFLIINWSDVSWIFNYKEVSGLVEDFFNPYPSIDASTMDAYFYPNHSQENISSVKIKGNYLVMFVYFGPGDTSAGIWSACQEYPSVDDANKLGPQQIKWDKIRNNGNLPNYVMIFPIKK